MLVPSLQIQEQSWDGGRAQELWDPDRVSMPAAETPAQAQDTVHLQEQLLMLTESQSSFPSTLQVPEVPVPLRKQLEAQESHPRLHEEMAEYWRTRWHQVAVALKFKEEELQRLQRQSGTWPPQDPHAAAERPECVLKELPSRMQALERENNQMAAGIQRRKGRPQQRPQARLQSLQREGAVGPQVCQGTGVCSVDSTRGQWPQLVDPELGTEPYWTSGPPPGIAGLGAEEFLQDRTGHTKLGNCQLPCYSPREKSWI
ncbi:PREDICTED: antigen LPMC-61 isoform X3 [Cercocebus atys]|uniref:antigen LPMC-61 isoform X3 n=1 Tax=Cercocebus atys TaxID=9531 RepID=UPI0005F3EA80|nr:PREDICTED: antigen LPMC-61 isoform X3 [Cercocebus atys]XP_011946247.1 PREDICTED: antigen LPMC-61 isoform X3 [Cercocebus atys]XP_011946248.1 PREDICTED: antigen LPMC-61 isoform X3 [Cercocebus atys]